MQKTLLIRSLDIFISLLVLLLLLPLIIMASILIPLNSPGPVFFLQIRVGKNGKDFRLIKFRTMYQGAEQHGALTIGASDRRITGIGSLLRTWKLDEIPQLINVLKGDMSLVGPRPELRKYVEYYTEEQKKVLLVRPGLTDYASIEYMNENEILGKLPDPEKAYIEEIMPAKIVLNRRFIDHPSLRNYLTVLFKTVYNLF